MLYCDDFDFNSKWALNAVDATISIEYRNNHIAAFSWIPLLTRASWKQMQKPYYWYGCVGSRVWDFVVARILGAHLALCFATCSSYNYNFSSKRELLKSKVYFQWVFPWPEHLRFFHLQETLDESLDLHALAALASMSSLLFHLGMVPFVTCCLAFCINRRRTM